MADKKSVLITGSSKGLGKELALIFSKNNYNVIIHGRDLERLKEVEKEILKNKVNCDVVQEDLKDGENLDKLYILARKRDLSILINNAAIDDEKDFDKTSLGEINSIIETNLVFPVRLTKIIYPFFIEKERGLIININAMDGLRNIRGKILYTTSKHGLRGFTDSLRYEVKRFGVGVMGVYLGGMQTEMYSRTGRDIKKAMKTQEVAEIIFDACKNYNTATIEDLIINKNKVD